LLLKYESLFDGTLGDWNRLPISIELKEGVKPYHGRPYPIPRIHKATLMKEINMLVGISLSGKQVCDSLSIRVSEISVYYENRRVVPTLGKHLFALHFAKA
jgi:hypothetical protein